MKVRVKRRTATTFGRRITYMYVRINGLSIRPVGWVAVGFVCAASTFCPWPCLSVSGSVSGCMLVSMGVSMAVC